MAPVPSGYPVRVDAGPHLPGGQGRGAVRGFAVRLEGRRGFELRGFGLGAALGVGESFCAGQSCYHEAAASEP